MSDGVTVYLDSWSETLVIELFPVLEAVKLEAKRLKIEPLILPTDRAIDHLNRSRESTNAVLHVTC
jgi:hypothetical protein